MKLENPVKVPGEEPTKSFPSPETSPPSEFKPQSPNELEPDKESPNESPSHASPSPEKRTPEYPKQYPNKETQPPEEIPPEYEDTPQVVSKK